MPDRDFHADRILAGVGMFKNEVAAGVFDIGDHPRGRVGARLLAHETDGALIVDDDPVRAFDAWTKALLHVVFSNSRIGV